MRNPNAVHKNRNAEQQHRDKIKNPLSIWIVTVSGKIYFRNNVHSLRPEGSNWIEVPFNDVLNSSDSNSSDNEQENQKELKIEEISKISVGSVGNCWCLTSCGRCLVRLGQYFDWENHKFIIHLILFL